jgi:hypothetical protein
MVKLAMLGSLVHQTYWWGCWVVMTNCCRFMLLGGWQLTNELTNELTGTPTANGGLLAGADRHILRVLNNTYHKQAHCGTLGRFG